MLNERIKNGLKKCKHFDWRVGSIDVVNFISVLNPLHQRESVFYLFVWLLNWHLTKRNLEPLAVYLLFFQILFLFLVIFNKNEIRFNKNEVATPLKGVYLHNYLMRATKKQYLIKYPL